MMGHFSLIHQKKIYQLSVVGSMSCWVLRMEYTVIVPKVPAPLVTEKLEPQLQRPLKPEAVQVSLFRVQFPTARYCDILVFV